MTTTEIATSSIDIFSDEVLQDPYPHYAALREEHKVGCGVYYPTPVHRLPTFAASAGCCIAHECS